MKEGSRTPWGKADFVKESAPGIWQVSTPGHGGYKLDRKRNATVHAAWRNAGGWYEEDCDWARVVITFPDLYTEDDRKQAHLTAKQYTPDEYMVVTGLPVKPEESRVLREREFRATVGDKLVSVAAWGDWHPGVPAGYVGLYACPGGDRTRPGKHFLATDEQYREHYDFGLVIDETKHLPWAGEHSKSKVAAVVTILEAT